MTPQPIAIIFVVLGIVLVIFHRPIGIGFFRLGKLVWRIRPLPMSEEIIGRAYDETRAPRIMILLGIISVVQGVIFHFVLPILYK